MLRIESTCDVLTKARRPSGPASLIPAVIFLDLKLPRLNGLDVLRCIRSNARTRLDPVAIPGSSREERDIVDSDALGANLRQLAAYRLLLNENPPMAEERQ